MKQVGHVLWWCPLRSNNTMAACSSCCLLYRSVSHRPARNVIGRPERVWLNWGAGSLEASRVNVESTRWVGCQGLSVSVSVSVCVGLCGVDMFVALCPVVLRRVWFASIAGRGITIRIQDTPATWPRLSSVTDWGYMQVEVEEMDWRVLFFLHTEILP